MNYKITSQPLKKIVVVDLEYMRPSVSRSRSRSRSRSNIDALEECADLNIVELPNRQYTNEMVSGDFKYDEDSSDNGTGSGTDADTDTDADADADADADSDSGIEDDRGCAVAGSHTHTHTHRHPSVQDADYAVNSDDDLLQSVLDEPTFPLDVNAILNAMNKRENHTIANLTLKKIAQRRREILSSLNLSTDKMEDFDRRLQMYRVIEDPQDLKHTQLLRWIPLRSLENKPYLTIGGTLFNVKVQPDDGLHQIIIRNVKRFVYQIKFELNVIFQRLSREELLILRAVEYVEDE